MEDNKVIVYSKNNCVQCKFAKKMLDNNDVEYNEINIDENPDVVDFIKQKYQAQAMPLVVMNGEVYARGNNPDGIMKLVEVIESVAV